MSNRINHRENVKLLQKIQDQDAVINSLNGDLTRLNAIIDGHIVRQAADADTIAAQQAQIEAQIEALKTELLAAVQTIALPAEETVQPVGEALETS